MCELEGELTVRVCGHFKLILHLDQLSVEELVPLVRRLPWQYLMVRFILEPLNQTRPKYIDMMVLVEVGQKSHKLPRVRLRLEELQTSIVFLP